MRNSCLLSYLLGIFFFSGCAKSNPEYFSRVENIMMKEPCKALDILDSVKEKMDIESIQELMYYRLLYTEACDRCYRTNPYDSLLLEVLQYYTGRNENEKLMKACYFMARKYLEVNEKGDPAALIYLFRALELSNDCKDFSFIGRVYYQISKSFVHMKMHDKAIRNLKTAYSYFQLGDDNTSSVDVLCKLGDIFIIENKMDSALCYYQYAYKLAESCGNLSRNEVAIRQNMVKIYIYTGEYEKAKQLLTIIDNKIKKSNKLNYNLAGTLYLRTGLKDSAAICFQRMLANYDLDEKKYASWNLFEIEKSNNKLEKALGYLQDYVVYADSIYTLSNYKALLKIKYLYELHHSEQEKEELRRENMNQRIWIIFVMVAMTFAIGLSLQYVRVKKQEARRQEELLRDINERQYQKSQKFIEDNNLLITELESQINSIQQEKDTIMKQLLIIQKEKLEQTNLAVETSQKQQALLEEELRKSEIYAYCFKAIENPTVIMTHDDWDKLEQELSKTYDNFSSRLFVLHPSITIIELHICMLIKIRLPISAISQLVCRTQSAVSMSRKLLFRKIFHKEGVAADLDEFIISF